MSAPRTKPWEVSSGTSTAAASSTTQETLLTQSEAPASIPDRPTSLTQTSASGGYNYGQGSNTSYDSGYGTSRYGNGFGGSTYGSGYGSLMYGGYGSGIGGYGSSMYGGYGSLMYGGYGSGMGGYGLGMYGGYGGGMYGQNGMGGPGSIAEGSQATFQLIESIIGAVGGFAQMLEATYMATHSSFFTMVSLAEQFGNLKNSLGSLLGIFAVIRFAKKLLYKITGKTFNNGISAKEFVKFESKQKKLEETLKKQALGVNKGRISLKPLLLFLAASIGFPYLLSKVIQALDKQQMHQQRRIQEQQGMAAGTRGPLDPKNLEFAKALYEFNPENPNIEIELKPKELVAILSKKDPLGNESMWWKVRSRSGKMGYVPLNYLSIIERAPVKLVKPPPVKEETGSMVEEFQKQ